MTHSVGGGRHVICIIITHCVRKSISDSPIKGSIPQTSSKVFQEFGKICKVARGNVCDEVTLQYLC